MSLKVGAGMTEVSATSSTGGSKNRKPEAYSLIPVEFLAEVARVYNYGATKYSAENWRQGYPWSWSYDALGRHLAAFWSGQEIDPESGRHHLAHAAFHLASLYTYSENSRYLEHDDRPQAEKPAESGILAVRESEFKPGDEVLFYFTGKQYPGVVERKTPLGYGIKSSMNGQYYDCPVDAVTRAVRRAADVKFERGDEVTAGNGIQGVVVDASNQLLVVQTNRGYHCTVRREDAKHV